MSHESIQNPPKSDNSFAPRWITYFSLYSVKFNGNCSKYKIVYLFVIKIQ